MRKFCASGVLEHCLIHNPIMIYWSTDACWLMYLKWLLLGGAFFVWRVLHTRHIFNYLNRCISMEHVGHGCNFPASVFGRNSNFGFSIHGVNLAIIAFGCSLVWMKDTQVICPILPLLNLWIGRRQCYLSTFGSSFWIAFIIILTFLFVITAMHCLLNFPHHCHSFLSHKIILFTAL